MNETELYFARQNFLWNLGIYFLIGLGIIVVLTLIINWFYEKWKYDWKYNFKKGDK